MNRREFLLSGGTAFPLLGRPQVAGAPSAAPLEARIEARFGLPLADAIRLRRWSVFGTLQRFAGELGVSPAELQRLLRAHQWDLMHAPALALQNQDLSAMETIRVTRGEFERVDAFLNRAGEKAAPGSRAGISCDREGIIVSVHCHEPRPDLLTARVTPGGRTGTERAFWDGDLLAVKKQLPALTSPALREWAVQFGSPRQSVLLDDCIVVFVTALDIGHDRSYLYPSPFMPDPAKWRRETTPRKVNRIFLEGAYYALAVNSNGAVLDVFFDPWEGGTICPAWPSEAGVAVKRGTDYWQAEVRIPWRSLRPEVNEDSVWGIDLARIRRGGAATGEVTRTPRSTLVQHDVAIPVTVIPPLFNPSITVAPLAAAETGREFPSPVEWAGAARASDFVDNQSGKKAEDVESRITHDAANLYVKFECHERDTALLQVVTREEEEAEYGAGNRRCDYLNRREIWGLGWGDYVEVILAPNLDYADPFHGGSFTFLVNSRGDLLERYYDSFGMYNVAPVPAWRSGTRVRVVKAAKTWTVEVAIPLDALCTMGVVSRTWGLNLHRAKSARITGGPAAHFCWSPTGQVYEAPTWPPAYISLRDGRRLGKMRIDSGRVRLGSQTQRPGPAITRTKPAGPPAHRRCDSDRLVSVCFVDKTHGWVVGGLGAIRHTSDGGESWREQDSGTDFALEKVFFVDREHGWAVGGWGRDASVALFGGAGVMLATTDGGKHWAKQLDDRSVWLQDVFFLDRRLGWAVGEFGVVLRTTDGGGHWRQVRRTGTTSWLYAVHFTDSRHGWAVGYDETILRSEDGGQSWLPVASPVPKRPHGWLATWRAVAFADERQGWIAGDGGSILRTVDGGKTWQLERLGLPESLAEMTSFEDLKVAPDGTVWAVSPMALLKKSADCGEWRLVGTRAPAWRRAISFGDGENGWLVGERGAILRTTNGGADWVRQRESPLPMGLLYATPHPHHLNGTLLGVLAEKFDTAYAVCSRGVREFELRGDVHGHMAAASAMAIGVPVVHEFLEFSWRQRYHPHCVAQRYQTCGGIEAVEKRLVTMIRTLRPRILVAEAPVIQEGYYAHGVGEVGRAVIRAFDSAADPGKFPELLELGLEPFAPDKLYIQTWWANELYRINPPTLRVRSADRFSERLGMTFADAKARSRGCYWGPDRSQSRKNRRGLPTWALHLKRTRVGKSAREDSISQGIEW